MRSGTFIIRSSIRRFRESRRLTWLESVGSLFVHLKVLHLTGVGSVVVRRLPVDLVDVPLRVGSVHRVD